MLLITGKIRVSAEKSDFLVEGHQWSIMSRNNGGMSAPVSNNGEPSDPGQAKVPLAGAKLDVAIKAMESIGFLDRLTLRIMKLAAAKGFFNPFDNDDVDFPGGKSASDLAVDVVEKAMDGSYTWDEQKQPDFYRFCRSRAESILSNWLSKNRRMTTLSPVVEENESGEAEFNAVNSAVDGEDIYHVLRFKEGGTLGDQLLEDFALSLPDKTHEQAILLAVHDDRECIGRAYCRGKIGVSEQDYDAAMKRIRRAAPAFLVDWCRKNNVKGEDRKEVR